MKPTWEAVPGSQSAYQITAEVIPRTAASGGGLSTVVLGDGGARDDAAYTGMTVTITAGPGTGESRVITGYDGATQTATVDGAWVHSPTATPSIPSPPRPPQAWCNRPPAVP